MKLTSNGKIILLIILIFSFILLNSVNIRTATLTYNFSTQINITATNHFANDGGCPGTVPRVPPNSYTVCGDIFDITGDSDLDISDNLRKNTNVEESGTDGFYGWLRLIANVGKPKTQITSINWTYEIFYDSTNDNSNNYSFYLWNNTGNQWQLQHLLHLTSGYDDEFVNTTNTTNTNDFVDSNNNVTFLIWGYMSAGAPGVGSFDTDFVKLEITYNTAPNISIVKDFSYPEDSAPLVLNLTGNETDDFDSGTNLNFNLSSNDTSKLNIYTINLSQNLFSLNLSANATGFVNISMILNDSLGLTNFSSFVVNITNINDPPSIPLLNSPSNLTTTSLQSPTFSWFNSSDVEGNVLNYTLEIYNHSVTNTTTLVYNRTKIAEGSSPSSHTINISLISATYYWRMFAHDGNQSDYSEERSFTINANFPAISNETISPSTPQIINFTAVRVNATVFDDDNNLDEVWIESDYITPGTFINYTGNHVTNITSNYTFLMEALNVTNHKTIKWRYWANDSGGNLAQGNTQQFTIVNMPPNATLNSPDNQSSTANTFVLLSVNSSDWDNDTVKIEFYGDSQINPTALINTTNLTAPGTTITFNWTGRVAGTTYYWRVKAIDNQNTSSDYSEERTFSIASPGGGVSGGGGGIEQTAIGNEPALICNRSTKVYWIAETQGGNKNYVTSFLKDSSRTRKIYLSNLGKEPINISLNCESQNNSCGLVNISKSSVSLEPNELKREAIDIRINTPSNSSYGDKFFFNVRIKDGLNACEGNIAFENILRIDPASIFSKLTNSLNFEIAEGKSFKVPLFLPSLFIIIIPFGLLYYLGRKINLLFFGLLGIFVSIALLVAFLLIV